ncbi:MAG: rhodanese-like domain-containing protein [Verrucomicrobia bacterium]|nr:rhodanese-like domain-containing protein [Verrucomicrobiota bacterium]
MTRRAARQVLLILSLALLPAVVQAVYMRNRLSWRQPATADEVSVQEAKSWGREAMWIDARPGTEYEKEHVPGALPLSTDEWDNLLPAVLNSWSPERKLVVYCSKQTCGASREVARRLREEAGLKNVFVLTGGWEAWKSSEK